MIITKFYDIEVLKNFFSITIVDITSYLNIMKDACKIEVKKDKEEMQDYIKEEYQKIEDFYKGNPTGKQKAEFNRELIKKSKEMEEKYKKYEIDYNAKGGVILQLVAIKELYSLSVSYTYDDYEQVEWFRKSLKEAINEK